MRAILTYHSIDPSGSPISVSPATFARQIDWLEAQGVAIVPLPELQALPPGSRAVAMTFDDGIANVATDGAPLLRSRGVTATVFVVSGLVGKLNRWPGTGRSRAPELPLLGWSELGRLRAEGWAIESHTRTHRRLPTLSDAELEEELEGSAADILAETGSRPRWLAYPFGAADARVAARTVSAYAHACTTTLRPLAPREQPMWLPRIDAWYLRAPLRRAGWGTPVFRALLGFRRLVRAARAAGMP